MVKKESKEDYAKRWERIVFSQADPSMIPEKPQIRSMAKIFHVQGTDEIFGSLIKAQKKAEELESPIITVSSLDKGIETQKDFFYFYDGTNWGKYEGQKRIG